MKAGPLIARTSCMPRNRHIPFSQMVWLVLAGIEFSAAGGDLTRIAIGIASKLAHPS
jgi:hypothetical protein